MCNEVQLNKNFYFLKKNKKEIFAQPYIQNTIKKTIKNDGHDEEFIDFFFLFSKKNSKRGMRRAKTYFCYEALLSSCFVMLRDFFIFFKHIFVLCFVWRETCLAFFAKYRSPDKVRKQTANQLIVYMSLHVFSPFFSI